MPQDSETGRQGLENGYNNADAIGALLNANRVSNNSNEFDCNGSRVVIKTGSSAVVTRATLDRVDAVVYGEQTDEGWVIYRVEPNVFDQNSIQSQSSNHDENYRLVRRAQIRAITMPCTRSTARKVSRVKGRFSVHSDGCRSLAKISFRLSNSQ